MDCISPSSDLQTTNVASATHATVRPATVPILILHRGGELLAYAPGGVVVRIVNIPVTSTAAGDLAAERLLEETLPRQYRDIFWPGNLRASGWLRTMAPDELEDRTDDIHLRSRLESAKPLSRREAITEAIRA